MDHSGNKASIIDSHYMLGGVALKVYVHDELDRFVTVAVLKVSDRDLALAREGIEQACMDHAAEGQMALPPWQ